MQEKERKALNRCFEDLVKDLHPSQTFLHSLYAEDILTEEQMDNISVSLNCICFAISNLIFPWN